MIAAACHIHSDWSYDGKSPLRELAAEFSRRGYRIVMVTEHDRGFNQARLEAHRAACAEAGSEDLLLLPGIEYSDAENIVHVLVWGSVPFLGEGVPTAELLRAVKAANGVAVFAHPSRRHAWKKFDPAWTEYLLGIEVWNRKTDGWAPSGTAPLLLRGTELLPFVGMDFHDRKQFFPMSMELDLNAPIGELSVIECMRSRRCNASVFGRPLQRVTEGWAGPALALAEHCRRDAAKAFRLLATAREPAALSSSRQ